MSSPTFAELKLSDLILRAVTAEGYTHPTPIQGQAIPHVLDGKDVLGCAQTGTGKTAAFSLPILDRLSRDHAGTPHPHPNQHRHRPIRALVLSPTRELALQIDESMRTYGRHTHLRTVCIFGGVNQNPQTRALKQGVDILVATPGRLIDLMDQGYVDLSHVEVFVLDEADRMLDMGFIEPIRRIAGEVPEKRQTLLFSATMPKQIRHLADSLLKNPVSVQVAPVSSTPDRVKQQVVFVPQRDKAMLLVDMLSKVHVDRCLVFTRTKHGADRVAKYLNHSGIPADAIHGNKRQNVRQRSLDAFKSGRTHVLVATDIAARGIDVDGISHVVNFDMPNEPETYVHRIGRTARAGATGEAVSFVDRSSDERHFLREIEKLTKRPIPSRDSNPTTPEQLAAHAETESRPDREESAPQRRPSKFGPPARAEHQRPSRPARPEQHVERNRYRDERPGPFIKRAPAPHAERPRAEAPRRESFNDAPRPQPKPHAAPVAGQQSKIRKPHRKGQGRPGAPAPAEFAPRPHASKPHAAGASAPKRPWSGPKKFGGGPGAAKHGKPFAAKPARQNRPH